MGDSTCLHMICPLSPGKPVSRMMQFPAKNSRGWSWPSSARCDQTHALLDPVFFLVRGISAGPSNLISSPFSAATETTTPTPIGAASLVTIGASLGARAGLTNLKRPVL
jgi:hypothetical protein